MLARSVGRVRDDLKVCAATTTTIVATVAVAAATASARTVRSRSHLVDTRGRRELSFKNRRFGGHAFVLG